MRLSKASPEELLREMEEEVKPRWLLTLKTVDGEEYEWIGSPWGDIHSRTGAAWVKEDDGFTVIPESRIEHIRVVRR